MAALLPVCFSQEQDRFLLPLPRSSASPLHLASPPRLPTPHPHPATPAPNPHPASPPSPASPPASPAPHTSTRAHPPVDVRGLQLRLHRLPLRCGRQGRQHTAAAAATRARHVERRSLCQEHLVAAGGPRQGGGGAWREVRLGGGEVGGR